MLSSTPWTAACGDDGAPDTADSPWRPLQLHGDPALRPGLARVALVLDRQRLVGAQRVEGCLEDVPALVQGREQVGAGEQDRSARVAELDLARVTSHRVAEGVLGGDGEQVC